MKNIIYIFIFFTINNVSAQLTVKNSSYIFANDQVVFVEDNVDLSDTNSKFYLRNDAQLLQGSGTTGNSGVGELSTLQNGTVHEYAYNFWCSPVGNIDASVNGNSPARVNLLDQSTGLISSTNTLFTTSYEGSSSPLTIARYWLWTYIAGDEYSNWSFVGNSGDIAPGLGFTMKGTNGSGNNQAYDFRGKPNSGTITNTVAADNFTLVGNPYPSAMDALDFIWDTNNQNSIDGTLYYWEQDLSVMSHYLANYVGGYATYTISSDGLVETFIPATFDTYNGDGSFNTTGTPSTSGKQAKRYIPIGQGFMVKGKIGTTGTVRTTNIHREYYKQTDTGSEFFRTSNTNEDNHFSSIPEPYKRFRLNIDFSDVYTRQLVQTFHGSATNGFDYGLESQSPKGLDSDVYWIINEKEYVAQALAFNEQVTIPLILKLDNQESIRIRIFDIQNFNENQPIFLHDKETNIYYDLKRIDFQTNLEAGIYDERFEITFKNGEQVNDLEIGSSSREYFGFYQNNTLSQLTIKNPELKNIKELNLFDVSGKLVVNNKAIENNSIYNISTKSLSNGTYIVVLTTDEKTFTKKIIISN